jgi:outer membrane protein, heavy metal efflux system
MQSKPSAVSCQRSGACSELDDNRGLQTPGSSEKSEKRRKGWEFGAPRTASFRDRRSWAREEHRSGSGHPLAGPNLILCVFCLVLFTFHLSPLTPELGAQDLILGDIIEEGLKNSPEIRAFQSRADASRYRVPQARSLPDPMFMFGYQNEGFRRFTIGEEPNAMGMFGLSQMFFFPGKRSLKEEMAARDAEGLAALHNAAKLRLAARIKELYYDLFLAHKTIDILKERSDLFSRVEDAATARYASGMGSQQEVVMAQTEKYMLLEKEEMQKQKIQALQGMLNTTIGRDVNSPLGRPREVSESRLEASLDDILARAREHSPEIKSREKMVQAAEAKVKMAKKEYYPDVTVGAGYFPKTQGMLDMWSLTATINLPVFYKTKQDQAVLEANASLSEAKQELQATEFMLASSVRDSYSMGKTAERLITLYKDALIPKAQQDVQLGLSGYVTGKTEAITIVSRLKTFLDVEILYWAQHIEKEKAVARLHAIMGEGGSATGGVLQPREVRSSEKDREPDKSPKSGVPRTTSFRDDRGSDSGGKEE